MRLSITLLLIIPFCIHDSYGQTFALAKAPTRNRIETSYVPGFERNSKHHRTSAFTIVGASCMCAAPIVGIWGYGEVLKGEHSGLTENKAEISRGSTLGFVSGVLFYGGLGMLIGGVIHTHHVRHKDEISIIAPKFNQIGLAYNF
jgi:hypothetical protein